MLEPENWLSPRKQGCQGTAQLRGTAAPALHRSRARADRKLLAPECAAMNRDRNMGGLGGPKAYQEQPTSAGWLRREGARTGGKKTQCRPEDSG